MCHIRRITAAISTVILTVLGFFAAAPAAFATRLDPPGDASAPASPAGASSGMAYWQVGLVALAAAVLAAIVTAIVLRLRVGAHQRVATA